LGFDELKREVHARIDAALPEGDIDPLLIGFLNALVVRGQGRYRVQPLARQPGNPTLSDAVRAYPADLARGQLSHTFNPWHQPVLLDAVTQFLLPYTDGSRTRAELLALLSKAVTDGTLKISQAAAGNDAAVDDTTLATELDRVLKLLCA
jgi:hypothetical protein